MQTGSETAGWPRVPEKMLQTAGQDVGWRGSFYITGIKQFLEMCQTAGRDRGHRDDHDGGDVLCDRDTCTLETSLEMAHNTGSSVQRIFNTSANVDTITTRSGKRAAELLMRQKQQNMLT